MLGLSSCPFDVDAKAALTGQKMDLGPCPKTHSDRILKQFKEAEAASPPDPRINAFRQEHENTIYHFVDECDRRIRASQRKLEKTPEENRKTVDLVSHLCISQ